MSEHMAYNEYDGWNCVEVCGNFADRYGFSPCDEHGIDTDPNQPASFLRCELCGRVANTDSGLVVNR